MTRWFSLAMVVATIGMMGCPRGRAPVPPPSESAGSACVGLPRNEMPRNEMPRNEMPRNGLAATALEHNRPLLGALASDAFPDALDEAMLAGWIPAATADDPDATRKLLKYIAACALDPCERLTTTHKRPDGTSDELALVGELGLCGDRYNTWATQHGATTEPTWRTARPTEGCQHRVSACVLSRVNAIGASIRISLRGDGMSLTPEVGVDTTFRENHGTPIHSFASCDTRRIGSTNPTRNCGWAPRHVGRCSRGTGSTPRSITVVAPGRIRICEGVYGCDDPIVKDMTPLVGPAGDLPSPPRYGGWMLATGAQSVTFPCPANGPKLGAEQTGYYAVMVDNAAPATVTVTASSASALDQYPGREDAVFTYREGAFYGSLFRPFPSPELPTMTLVGAQYACYSDVWTEGHAMLADRLCARATSKLAACFANKPGPCDDSAAGPGRCTPLPDSTARVADACHEAQRWREPYTTFLNHPCDLSANDETCASRMNLSAAPWVREQILARGQR